MIIPIKGVFSTAISYRGLKRRTPLDFSANSMCSGWASITVRPVPRHSCSAQPRATAAIAYPLGFAHQKSPIRRRSEHGRLGCTGAYDASECGARHNEDKCRHRDGAAAVLFAIAPAFRRPGLVLTNSASARCGLYAPANFGSAVPGRTPATVRSWRRTFPIVFGPVLI